MKKNIFTCIIVILISCVILVGCGENPEMAPAEETAAPDETEIELTPAPSTQRLFPETDELDKYDFTDAKITEICFGEGFAGVFTSGYKLNFTDNKLLYSDYYGELETTEKGLDPQAVAKFQKQLKEMALYKWKSSYYDESDYEEGACYDGGWMIEVSYDNGYKKTITGFDVPPEKGDDFKNAVHDLCGVKWAWGDER